MQRRQDVLLHHSAKSRLLVGRTALPKQRAHVAARHQPHIDAAIQAQPAIRIFGDRKISLNMSPLKKVGLPLSEQCAHVAARYQPHHNAAFLGAVCIESAVTSPVRRHERRFAESAVGSHINDHRRHVDPAVQTQPPGQRQQFAYQRRITWGSATGPCRSVLSCKACRRGDTNTKPGSDQ